MAFSAGNTALSEPQYPLEKEKEAHFVSVQAATPSHFSDLSTAAFEEYLFQAAVTRRIENEDAAGTNDGEPKKSWLLHLSDHKGQNVNLDVKDTYNDNSNNLSPDEIERLNASRALRLASWASVFYLITTDILGPFNAPYAISQVGWTPGVLLYFFMGAVALYTGLILWRLYMRLDSLRYPIRTYSDIAERIFGTWARHLVTVLQSVQLIVNVGTLCLSNGQSLSQITKGHLCFAVCIVIWAGFGMTIGQIRTLKNYGWLANGAVWINLSIIFISMGFIANSPPNYKSALASLGEPMGPVVTENIRKLPLYSKVNGVLNMVFAYGGAMIFPEMMAEMRRPMDFWKGMVLAQALIFSAYLLYGLFVYHYQGQFTLPLAYQGVSKYAWQTVGNALALVTGIIAAGLYGNIGIKVIYINVVEKWIHGPPLMSAKGRSIWTIMVVAYWSLAFIVGSAIPQVQTISGLIAAVCITQFTYTIPPILRVGYDVITDAMQADKPYVHGSGDVSTRIDTWKDWSRWKRGLFSGRWYFKLFNIILFLASLSMACLGMWGSGKAIQETFKIGAATSFSCTGPV